MRSSPLITVLVLGTVGLGGCASPHPELSSHTPVDVVSSPPVVTTAASPSVVTPRARPAGLKLPPQATRNDPTGAAATVTYYFQAVDHAFATGNVSPLREISTATNRTTADLAERAGDMHREGSIPLGVTQQAQVVSAAKVPSGASSVMAVMVRYSSPQVQVQGRTGQVTQVAAVPARTVTVRTVRVADRWLVESVSDPATARP